jgi:hypothetical protein
MADQPIWTALPELPNRRTVLRISGVALASMFAPIISASSLPVLATCTNSPNVCTANTCTAAKPNNCGGPGGGSNTCTSNKCEGASSNSCHAAGQNSCYAANTCEGDFSNECHAGNRCGSDPTDTAETNTCTGKLANGCSGTEPASGDQGNLCIQRNTCLGTSDPGSNVCTLSYPNMCADNTCNPSSQNSSL